MARERRILAMGHGRSPYLASTLLPTPRSEGEVAWGVGSDGGWVFGYKLHLLVDLNTGERRGLRVIRASCHDSPMGRRMLLGVEVVPGEKPAGVVGESQLSVSGKARHASGEGAEPEPGEVKGRGCEQLTPSPLFPHQVPLPNPAPHNPPARTQ